MNNINKKVLGHILAVICIIVWGTTFISTKVLLVNFNPYEIIIYRLILAYLILLIICPKFMRITSWKKELLYLAAALSGASFYQVLENLALEKAYASTTSVIIATAPLFTGIFAWIFLKEKLNWKFFAGFVLAMAGISLVSLQGSEIGFSLAGTAMAVIAATLWGIYSVVCKKMGSGENIILVTRRVFFYGILTMIPMYFIFDCHFELTLFSSPVNLLNMLYLGIVASGLCFLIWNIALKSIGVVTSGIYVYSIPIVTVIFSAIILKEQVTWRIFAGIALAIAGLLLSADRGGKKNG